MLRVPRRHWRISWSEHTGWRCYVDFTRWRFPRGKPAHALDAPSRRPGAREVSAELSDLEITRIKKRRAEASARWRARNPRVPKSSDSRIRITERPPKFQRMHGMSKTKEYRAWHQMRERCFNPRNNAYKDYGGRGITVCERWTDFENFYADLGPRPVATSLDRFPNNDGNYQPDNCRWATAREQAANTRQTKVWSIEGVIYHGLGEAMASLGLKRSCIQWRIKSKYWPDYKRLS